MISYHFIIASVSIAGLLWTLSFLLQHHSFVSDIDRDGPDVLFGVPELTQLVFAIKHRSVKELQDLLKKVSDPRSPSFGQYLSLGELRNLTYNKQGYDAVMDYLRGQNVVNIRETVNRDFIIIDIPSNNVEQVLGTTSTVYSDGSPKQIVDNNLPEELSDFVDFISGAKHRSSWRKAQRLRKPVGDIGNGPVVKGYVTPRLLNNFYHIYNNEVDRNTAAALFEALGQSYSHEDLFKFEETFGIPLEDIDVITGPNRDSACQVDPGSCGEANLDVQYFIAIAQHARTTYWSIDANDPDPFLTWIVALADDANPPLVHSISYGGDERQEYYSDRFNQELIKLGLRGITVVVSSGDDGVNSPELRQDSTRCGMTASFPASSPYVVAVGATQGPESEQEEVACSSSTGGIITSGGGFSSQFEQPDYQKAAVQNYLNTVPAHQLPSRAEFNVHGRAYPDVSLLGYNYVIFDSLKCLQESGTSASAPVFAAMLTLINSELAKNNLSPLGFINPLLYSLHEEQPEIFNDIVKGDNRCAAGYGDNVHCCDFGFYATKGFDPVTGLGSVHFSRLKKSILQIKKGKQMERFSGFMDVESK